MESKKKQSPNKAGKTVKAENIPTHPDRKIDQDFKGFPHGTAKEELINPKTKEQKKTAALHIKDGEKMMEKEKNKSTGEQQSDGSAGAFEATEEVKDDD